MELDPLTLAIAFLANWRIANLLHDESGPFEVFSWLRSAVEGVPVLGPALHCFFCLSLWTAIPFAVYLSDSVGEWVGLWLAISGGSILIYRVVELSVAIELFFVEPEQAE